MTIQKLPSPNEYWRARSGKILLIVCDMRQHDSDWSGPYPIISISKSGCIATHDASGRDYNDTDESPNDLLEYLSDCTGFDWQPQPPIDPGEGWELLPVGTVREREDEFTRDAGKTWKCTKCYGERIPSDSLLTFRRRKPTAETWPKWYVHNDVKCQWFIKRSNERKSTIHRFFGEDGESTTYNWDLSDSASLANGVFIEVTESEALARVKPAEPIAQAVERTATAVVESPDDWVTQDCVPARPGIDDRRYHYSDGSISGWDDSANINWDRPVIHGAKIGTVGTGYVELRCRRRDLPQLTPFPDQFAAVTTAIRSKKEAPLPALIPGVATDRMVDLFLSWRLPSDFQPDGGISFTSRPIHESWPTGTNLFTASQARKMIEHLLSVPEETAPQEPQPKRIPLSLWVSHRLISEHGDWPIRCTPADEEFDDGGRSVWKEIKFDGGFYVEGER